MIFEQNEQGNNTFDHTINIDGGQANLQPANFQINGGLEGAFQGLDAVRCSVVIRNVGTGPVAPGDTFDYQVLLSNDLTPSTDDFLLRQVDLGSNGLGEGLFPNETITLDWVQRLPDNFEGDFYVLSEINGVPSLGMQTPSLSLRSENTVTISSESAQGGQGHHHSRPNTTLDGQMIAHESLSNGLNQIPAGEQKHRIDHDHYDFNRWWFAQWIKLRTRNFIKRKIYCFSFACVQSCPQRQERTRRCFQIRDFQQQVD